MNIFYRVAGTNKTKDISFTWPKVGGIYNLFKVILWILFTRFRKTNKFEDYRLDINIHLKK